MKLWAKDILHQREDHWIDTDQSSSNSPGLKFSGPKFVTPFKSNAEFFMHTHDVKDLKRYSFLKFHLI